MSKILKNSQKCRKNRENTVKNNQKCQKCQKLENNHLKYRKNVKYV